MSSKHIIVNHLRAVGMHHHGPKELTVNGKYTLEWEPHCIHDLGNAMAVKDLHGITRATWLDLMHTSFHHCVMVMLYKGQYSANQSLNLMLNTSILDLNMNVGSNSRLFLLNCHLYHMF